MSSALRFLLITSGPVGSIPGPTGSGAAMGCWSIIEFLRNKGHEVSVAHITLLGYKPDEDETRDQKKRLRDLADIGVEVDQIAISPLQKKGALGKILQVFRSVIQPRVSDFYPYSFARTAVRDAIEKRRPQGIYHMSTVTLPTTDGYCTIPRLVITGDLDDLQIYYRWKITSLRYFDKYVYRYLRWLAARNLNDALIKMMKSCQMVISVAYHIVSDFKKQGIECAYVPNPWATNTPEPLCLLAPTARGIGKKPKIIMLGHLAGTATLSGLYYLVKHTLHHLEKILGRDGFEIHIIGRDALPSDLQRKLNHPAIQLRGWVDNIFQEYVEADIMLVPTDLVFGARTRIAEAFSLGCCVVAHEANAPGMPEMIHDKNILLASNGKDLAAQIARAIQDPALRRRIGTDARKTWETYYAPEKAIYKIAAEVERIALERLQQKPDALTVVAS